MSSIRNQLTKIAVTKMRTPSGETYAEILKHEVDRLYDCIQDEIDRFYNSYSPSFYHRTNRFRHSLYAEDLADIRINGNSIELSIRFDSDNAFHNNFDNTHETNVAVILNFGYIARELEKQKGGVIPYFTRRDGFHFVENGILRWNRTNRLGIEIDVKSIYNGREFTYF